MKLFPQPITSPSRLEKFPPPLMRSLRSNGRSKSRGRSSRLSPMFINNKKNGTATETQEPSSPKVTCFGQVRVRRSNNQTTKKKITRKNRYDWIQKPLFCKCFVGKPKTTNNNNKTSKSVWERWFVFFHQRKMEEIVEESVNIESRREEVETEEYKDTDDDDEEIVAARVFTQTSPPKNALLLMRSRSDIYRPSSLANLFWGSPVATEDDPTKEEEEEEEEEEKPRSKTEPTLRDSTGESRTGQEIEEKLGFCEEIESSRSSTTIKSTKLEDELGKLRRGSDLARVLRRTKSDPERRSGEPDSENSFWKRRRLGFEEQCPHS